MIAFWGYKYSKDLDRMKTWDEFVKYVGNGSNQKDMEKLAEIAITTTQDYLKAKYLKPEPEQGVQTGTRTTITDGKHEYSNPPEGNL